MGYIFNNEDYEIACQSFCKTRTKIEIYDMDDRLIDILEGTIDGGSSDITADSNVKRTFSTTIVPDNEHSINVAADSLLWIDKKMKLYTGLQTLKMSNVKWIPQGEYILTGSNVTYNATTNQLQIDCGDKMLNLDGTVKGEIWGALSLEIPAYEVIFKKSWLTEYSSFEVAYESNHASGDLLNDENIRALVEQLFSGYDSFTDIQKAEYIKQIQTVCDSINKVYKIAFGESDNDVLLLAHKTIKSVIKTILSTYTDVKRYMIEDIGEYNGTKNNPYYEQYRIENPLWDCVPYTETFSTGTTVASIIETYCTLYPGYDYGFDDEGIFYVKMIPTLYEDEVILTYKQLQTLLLPDDMENSSTDLSKVRNVCEVWGQCFDTDYYSDVCVSEDIYNNITQTNTNETTTISKVVGCYYKVTVDKYEKYTNGDIISIKFNSDCNGKAQININGLGAISIYNDADGKIIKAGDIKANNVYSLKYKKTYSDGKYIEKFYLLGQYQVHALCVLSNGIVLEDGTYSKEYFQKKYNCNAVKLEIIKDSPFVVQEISERHTSYSGDIYDNIQSDSAAIEQAKYELWKNCRITDNVTITTTLLPGINDYQKLSYKMANSKDIKQYVTHNIHHDYKENKTQIEMYTFYPLYEDEYTEENLVEFAISKNNYSMAGIHDLSGNIVIPERFFYGGVEYKVTSIENSGFNGCTEITSLTMPDTVTTIGTGAFNNCTSLLSVTLSNALKNITYSVFGNCTALETYTIPNTVTKIGDFAFYRTTSLKSIKFNRGVKKIGYSAFSECGLEKINIPGNVREIGTYAFNKCTNLTEIEISEGVKIIREGAFTNTSFDIIFLPNSLTTVEDNSFNSGIAVYNGDLDLSNAGFDEVISRDIILSSINIEMFGLDDLTSGSVAIPETFNYRGHDFNIVGIAGHTFEGNNDIVGIHLPSTIQYIGSGAFSYCSNLISVNMQSCNVTSMGEYVFGASEKLMVVYLPENLTAIPNNTFINCCDLTYVGMPKKLQSIGDYAFYHCYKKLTSVSLPETLTSIGQYAFASCTYLRNIILPDSLEQIGDYAFMGCGKLSTIGGIPDKITHIGTYTFGMCTALGYSDCGADNFIGKNVTSIADYAFYLCHSLSGMIIPNTVTSIGNKAFHAISSITYDGTIDELPDGSPWGATEVITKESA